MTTSAAAAATTGHLPPDVLLDYWLHDSDDATTERVDEHLMQCEDCGRALDELVALGEGIRSALRAGAVSTVAPAAFVQHLAAQGLRVREYRVPPGGSVNCTVAPDDDVLVSRMEVPLAGVQRLDAVLEMSTEPGVRHELHDLPFDPRAGEVLHLYRMAHMKGLPDHTARLTLLAVEPGGRRELGRYTFHHRAWPGA
jgi:hypothetical protein